MRIVAPIATALLAFAYAAAPASPSRASSTACGDRAYAYAGYAAAQRSHGVAAVITPLELPDVANGQVAAWIGVGGPGEGPHGEDEWLQAGISGFSDHSAVYYEVARPGRAPQYAEVLSGLEPGERHRVAVVELRGRPSWWRVFVDRRPVTQPIFLPRSDGRWAPIVTAESWNGGAAVCNSFAYRFGRVATATAPGGVWTRFRSGHRFQDRGYEVVRVGSASFLARDAS
jgi:hypothetical protein